MKILFSLLAFCLFASCVHSQEVVDKVSVRVQYRALYKHTQEQKEAYDDINLLDIGRHSSRFYSQRFEQFLHQRDSVKSVNADHISYLQFLANTFGSKKGREYEVYKHIPQRGTLIIRSLSTTEIVGNIEMWNTPVFSSSSSLKMTENISTSEPVPADVVMAMSGALGFTKSL